MAGAGDGGHSFDQRQNGARIGTDLGFEIELAAGQQDGDAVIADGTGEQHLVAGTDGLRRDVDTLDRAADAATADVHVVGFAMLDDLGIAGRDDHTRAAGGGGHGAHFEFEDFGGQTGFEHISDDEGLGAGAGDGQIVHRAIDGQFAYGTTGETQGFDDEGVGGDRQRDTVDGNMGGVTQRSGRAIDQARG